MKFRKTAAILGIAAMAAVSGCGQSTQATEGEWEPTKPVEFVVGSSAGGGSDTAARKLAELFNSEGIVEQPVNVVNNIGGGGQAAFSQLSGQNRGDGHYLLMVATAYLTTPLQLTNAATLEDFTNFAVIAEDPWVTVASHGSEYETLSDLEGVGQVTYGGAQVGALDSIAAQALREEVPAELKYIPYDGVADVTTAIMGGDVAIGGGPFSATEPLVEAGRLQMLGVMAPERLEQMPDVPTATEQGYALEYAQLRGVVGPPELTDGQREYWEDAIKQATETDAWQEFLTSGSQQSVSYYGEEAENYLQDKSESYSKTLDTLGLLE